MDIKLNKIIPVRVNVKFEGEVIGTANHLEVIDLQIQIATYKATGYSLEFDGNDIRITSDGEINFLPKGMFDAVTNAYRELIRARTGRS